MIARSYTTETIRFRPRPFPDRSERGSIYLTWADNPENRVDETSTWNEFALSLLYGGRDIRGV